MVEVPVTKGTLVKGDLLLSSWNDANNNPGQGQDITQFTKAGAISIWATVPKGLVRACERPRRRAWHALQRPCHT